MRSQNKRKRRRSSSACEVKASSYDQLEPRQLLTTFFVDTLLDQADVSVPDGLISMREAITAANTNQAFGDAPAGQADGDRIVIDPALKLVDRPYTAISFVETIQIDDDLSIHGNGNTVGSGNPLDTDMSVFSITTSERVAFGNLHMAFSDSDRGGAIYDVAGGTTVLQNVTFRNHHVSEFGGAIYHENGFLSVVDSSFDFQNSAGLGGGAIYSKGGTVKLSGAEFTNSYTFGEAGAIYMVDGHLESTDVKFGNGNYNGGLATPGMRGGAILLEGNSTALFSGGTFLQNESQAGGGAIWMSADSEVEVNGTRFEKNSGVRGGAIFNNGGPLKVSNAEFVNNYAGYHEDQALIGGGAIYLNGGNTEILDTLFEENIATIWGQRQTDAYAGGKGGAIQAVGGNLTIKDAEFTSNESQTNDGGAIHINNGTTLEIDTSTFKANSSNANGGSLWMGADTKVTLFNSSFSDSAAENRLSGGGGGIFNGGGELNLERVFITGNVAREGGGILSVSGNVNVLESRITNNEALGHGGGLRIYGGSVRLAATSLDSNFAGQDPDRTGNGGGAYLTGNSRLTFTSAQVAKSRFRLPDLIVSQESTLNSNQADAGGAIWIGHGSSLLLLSQTRIESNIASNGSGGAIFSSGHLRTQRAYFANNSASENGGAVYLSRTGTAQLYSQTNFSEQSAMRFGGAIFNDGFLVIREPQFTANTAGEFGDDFWSTARGRVR